MEEISLMHRFVKRQSKMLQVVFLPACREKKVILPSQYILFYITDDPKRLSTQFPDIINAIPIIQKVSY